MSVGFVSTMTTIAVENYMTLNAKTHLSSLDWSAGSYDQKYKII